MHRHHAVVLFASRPAPLPLHTGRPVPLFRTGGLVDQSDRVSTGVITRNAPLQRVDQLLLVPFQRIEKLLQRPRRDTGGQGDRLDALAIQLRQLALDVRAQVLARVLTAKAIIKLMKELFQLRFQATNLGGVHAWVSSCESPTVPHNSFDDSDRSTKTDLAL